MINEFLLNFELLFNDLDQIVIIVNEYGVILKINNTALDILSYSIDEILNKSISELCCDKTLENVVKCSITRFNVNLCSKYKKIIPVNGKSSFLRINNTDLIVIKLYKIEEEVFTRVITKGNEKVEYAHFIKDLNGRYLFVNEAFENNFGVNRTDIFQKFDFDLWEKEQAYKFRREDLYVMSTKKTCISYSTKIINDEVFYFETFKSPLFDGNNKVVGIIGNIREVTESVKLRNELVVQNEQLSIIYKILNNSSSKINLESLFSSLYKDFKTLLKIDSLCVFLYNFDLNELEYCTSYGLSQTFVDSYVNSDAYRNFITKVFESKIPIPMTSILEFGNGIKSNYVKAEGMNYYACYPLTYNNESFGVIILSCNSEEYSYSWDNKFMDAVCKNISILLQNAILYTKQEENLKFEKEASEQINLYFDTTLDFYCIIDNKCSIKKISKHMLETLGYTEEEVLNLKITNFIHKDEEYIIKDYIRSFTKDITSEFLIRVLCKTGDYRTVDWNVKYLKDRGIFICSGRDLTYKLELENKKRIVDESYQLEKLKSEFLSSISHELRTPIAIIYGSILNMETNLNQNNIFIPKKIYENIESVKKNTFRLLRLFNNILDITNVDAGFANLNLANHNIVKVIEDISLSVSKLLKGRNISLIFDTDIEEKYVNIDVVKMERVMLNLISNSVKYSKKGIKTEIMVKVYEEDEKLYISVKDNGIGIEPTHLEKIFSRFNQIDASMTRNAEGSGIGLYLVKVLLQMQGADIKVNSIEGEGSEFIIEMPIYEGYNYNQNCEEYLEDFYVKIENFDMEFSDIYY